MCYIELNIIRRGSNPGVPRQNFPGKLVTGKKRAPKAALSPKTEAGICTYASCGKSCFGDTSGDHERRFERLDEATNCRRQSTAFELVI